LNKRRFIDLIIPVLIVFAVYFFTGAQTVHTSAVSADASNVNGTQAQDLGSMLDNSVGDREKTAYVPTAVATELVSEDSNSGQIEPSMSVEEYMNMVHITPATQTQDGSVGERSRRSAYNRTAAVNWAVQNNYNNQGFYGDSQGRYCTTYVGKAMNAGGMNTSTSWYGNQQFVQWMWNNQEQWEFRAFSELQPGDVVLYGWDQYNGNTSNWMDTDPTTTGNNYQYGPSVNFAGWSRFGHIAIVTQSGKQGNRFKLA